MLTLATLDWGSLGHNLAACFIFGGLGVFLLALSYKFMGLIERKLDIDTELHKKNLAVAIFIGSYVIGVVNIISQVIVPTGLDLTNWGTVAENVALSSIFIVIGFVLLALSYKLLDLVTPKLRFDDELRDQNVPLSIFLGAYLIAVSQIAAVIIV